MATALVVTAGIVLARSDDAGTRLIVLAVAFSKAVEGMSDIYYAALQRHERMRPIALSLVWRGVCALLAVSAALLAGAGLLGALLALDAAWVAVLAWYDRPTAWSVVHEAVARLDRRAVLRLVATSLPLGLVIMLVSLRTNVPRYFVEAGSGAAELGVFAALSSLLTAGNVVVSALGQSAVPRLARHFHERDLAAFRRLLARLLALAAAVGVAGIAGAALVGRPLLLALFGEPYAAQADLLVALMGVGLLAYVASFLGYALTSARRFQVQLPLFAATTLRLRRRVRVARPGARPPRRDRRVGGLAPARARAALGHPRGRRSAAAPREVCRERAPRPPALGPARGHPRPPRRGQALGAAAIWVLCLAILARSLPNGFLSPASLYLVLLGLFHLGLVTPVALGLAVLVDPPMWLASRCVGTALRVTSTAMVAFTLGARARAHPPRRPPRPCHRTGSCSAWAPRSRSSARRSSGRASSSSG